MKLIFSDSEIRSDRYFLYNYNGNNFRLVKVKCCKKEGFEEINPKNHILDYNSDEVIRCSLSRTRRNIREIALCNNFEYFVTITVNGDNLNRFNLDDVQNQLKKSLKKIKRKNSDFQYIIITERHVNGAFHFHGLVKGLDEKSSDLYINKYGYLSSHILDTEIGYVSFSKIKDLTRVSNYITKYITKSCVKNSHNQVYISSKGLIKATREEFSHIDFIPSYSNDFVDIKDFTLDELSTEQKLYFLQLKEGKTTFMSNIKSILNTNS